MPNPAVKERLAKDLALWQADGLVSAQSATVLRERYDVPGFGLVMLIKYLGIAGGLLAGFGILGMITAAIGSLAFASTLGLAASAAFFWVGLKLSTDPLGRYPQSSKVVLVLAVIALASGAVGLLNALHVEGSAIIAFTGFVCLPITFFLAYRYQNTFLLVIGLIGAFHWVGSWSSMIGRNSYAFEVQDPRAMFAFSLAVLAAGIGHQRYERRFGAFHLAYQSMALVYLNLSLLILSVFDEKWTDPKQSLPWIIVWAVAGIGQMLGGARIKSSVLMAFGVTALSINLFTRYFEEFWDRLDLGLFLLIGGALIFAVGVVFERLIPKLEGARS